MLTKTKLTVIGIWIGLVLFWGFPSKKVEAAPPTNFTKVVEHINKKYKVDKDTATKIVKAAQKVSKAKEVDVALVLAVIEQESNFKPAVQNKCCTGLMQVNQIHLKPDPAKLIKLTTREELKHIDKNIEAGSTILVHYINKHPADLNKALTKYSGGHKKYANDVQARAYKYTQLIHQDKNI